MTANWQVEPFNHVVKDVTGGNVKTKQSEFQASGEYPIVDQGKTLVAGYTDDESRVCKATLPVVVFGDHTKCLKFIDFPFCLGADGTKILQPNEMLDAKYLFHYLHSIKMPDAGYSRHFKFLKQADVSFPRIEEQRRIAKILDKADDLRRLRQNSIDRLDDLGQAIFFEMFGKANEPVAFLRRPLGDVCEVSSGSTPSRKRPEYYGGDIPWVKTTEVRNGTILYTEEHVTDVGKTAARLKLYPANTVLVAMYGQGKTRGKVGILGTPATVNQACAAIVASEELDPMFLFYQLRLSYEQLRSLGRGGNQPNLNAGLVKGFELIVPPIDQQRLFSARLGSIHGHAQQLDTSDTSLSTLFASLQQSAFAGEL